MAMEIIEQVKLRRYKVMRLQLTRSQLFELKKTTMDNYRRKKQEIYQKIKQGNFSLIELYNNL